MKCICYTRPDGGISIVVPARKSKSLYESEQEFLARVISKAVPEGSSNVRLMEDSEFPQDRTFREAWRDKNGKIEIDLDSARKVQKDRIRKAKLRKAKELIERDMMGEDITFEKQQLQKIDENAVMQARSPEELKSLYHGTILVF